MSCPIVVTICYMVGYNVNHRRRFILRSIWQHFEWKALFVALYLDFSNSSPSPYLPTWWWFVPPWLLGARELGSHGAQIRTSTKLARPLVICVFVYLCICICSWGPLEHKLRHSQKKPGLLDSDEKFRIGRHSTGSLCRGLMSKGEGRIKGAEHYCHWYWW